MKHQQIKSQNGVHKQNNRANKMLFPSNWNSQKVLLLIQNFKTNVKDTIKLSDCDMFNTIRINF